MVELISFFIQAGGPISKTHPLDDVLFKAAIETFGLFSPLLLDSLFMVLCFLLEADGVSCYVWLYVNLDTFDKRKGTCASVLNSHCCDDLLFPYNEWQWRATMWSWWQWRCRCRLARYCYRSRTTSNPAGACSSYSCVEQHAPSRIRYCSLRSWGWLCKVRATQLHHRNVLPKPVQQLQSHCF